MMERWLDTPETEPLTGRLRDKVAVITGASSGIGRAIAFSFAREGAHVVCADIRESSTHEDEDGPTGNTTAELVNGLYVRMDVTCSQDMQDLVRTTVEHYGRIDIFVNNAGIAVEAASPRPIWAADEDTFDMTQRVNTKGVFLGCKYASAQMRTQEPLRNGDRGSIINISSVLSTVGTQNAASVCASKGAVTALTRAVASDCAPYRIHVNAISPGYVVTGPLDVSLPDENTRERLIDLHPFRGLGIPDDIARAAVFLASEDSSWITGTNIPVDGGFLMAR